MIFAENSVVGEGMDYEELPIFIWKLSLLWKMSMETFSMNCIRKCFDDRRASKLKLSTP